MFFTSVDREILIGLAKAQREQGKLLASIARMVQQLLPTPMPPELMKALDDSRAKHRALEQALALAEGNAWSAVDDARKEKLKETPMVDIGGLIQQIKDNDSVVQSAILFVNGTADRIQAAVNEALANGATEAQLQPLVAEIANQKARTDELAAAILANTPASPPA